MNKWIVGLVPVVLVVTSVVVMSSEPDILEQRQAYADFINNHPYMQDNRVRSPGPPGLDDPGARAEFEFIRTLDPALGEVPFDRLLTANKIGQEMLSRSQGAPPVTTETWEERGPSNIGGRTRAIMFDPNDVNAERVWAGGVSGGLWSTSDITTDGVPWVSQNDFWENLAITSMDYDPTNTQVFYVATGEGFRNFDSVRGGGIFKSTNGGTSFSRLPSTDPSVDIAFQFTNDVVVTDTGTVLAATREGNANGMGGIQRSTDGGDTWTRVLGFGVGGGTSSQGADIEVAANGDIYVSLGIIFTPGAIFKSIDDGLTWTQMTMPFPSSGNANSVNNYERIDLCTAPSDSDVVYAVTQGADNRDVNHIFFTENGGTTWNSGTVPTTGGQAWYDLICQVSPTDSDTLFLGVQIRFQRSTDGAGSWSLITGGMHPDFHAMTFRPGFPNEAVIGHDGGVDYTANVLASVPTYVDRNDGYNVTQYYGGDLSPTPASDVAIGGTQDNSTHYFDSPGIDVVDSPAPLSCCDGGFAVIDQSDANFAVGTIQFGNMARSFDGGATFSGFFGDGNGGLFIPNIVLDEANGILFRSSNQNTFPNAITRIPEVTNQGSNPTLEQLTLPITLNAVTSTHTVSPYSPPGETTLFVGTTAGQVVKITGAEVGGALAAEDITGSINPGFVSSITVGATEDQLLVSLSNYGVVSVYETRDGGTTWLNKEGDLPDIPIRWVLYNPNNYQQVLAATESGLWETRDITPGVPRWLRVPGFPTVRADQLQDRSSDQKIYVFTHGRGVWSSSWLNIPPIVDFEDGFEQPSSGNE